MIADQQVIVGRKIYQPGEELPDGLDLAVDRRDSTGASQAKRMDSLIFSEGDASAEAGAGSAPASAGDLSPPDGSISDVKTWVDGDLRRAQAALDAELAAGDSARSTLVLWLRDVLDLTE